jgi:ATP-binding protein involved in chromosome partitioning
MTNNEAATEAQAQTPATEETCDGACSSCASGATCSTKNDEEVLAEKRLAHRLSRIKHQVAVLSGKGGVGKSTVAVNLAVALLLEGKKVGLLDVDVHGPSIPTMLGLEGAKVTGSELGLEPVDADGLKVMSIGLLIRDADEAIIWRGPAKSGVIKQLLSDVNWGDLDYLIIDTPPGTGDEMLTISNLISNLDGAVIVTTPQKVSAVDVRKSISFCRTLEIPILGLVENMSGFACPHCGEITPILSSGGGEKIAADMDVPFLGSVPMDPQVAIAGDSGRALVHHFAETPTAQAMRVIIKPVLALDEVAE